MRNYEFFAVRLEQETPAFLKVLRAVPQDQVGYRPHEKNTSAGDLAWQITTEMESMTQLFDNNGVVDYKMGDKQPPVAELVDRFEKAAKTVAEKSRAVHEDVWKGPGKFLWNGQPVWEASVADIAWGFLFDLVHHRGQMTAYLRPMGAKVPAVYGPSGDER